MFKTQEKPLDWTFRRKAKTHFANRQGCQSDPKTNTPGLYDGSAEARTILSNAREALYDSGGSCTFAGEHASWSLLNALEYLKGKDILGRSFTHSRVLLPRGNPK